MVMIGGLFSQAKSVRAQVSSNPTYCTRPLTSQIVLYVNTPTFTERNWVRGHFPVNVQGNISDCLSGQGSNFTKILGFISRDQALQWQGYFNQNLRTPTYLFPETVVQTPPTPAAPREFKPRRVAWQGYSVLVDYQNNPNLVEGLRAYSSQPIALTSFVGRPYLLVGQHKDTDTAIAMAQQLSSNGYWVFIVKSVDVTLLSDTVY
ncbi:MAG: hypothetical protein HC796_11595 [Synechococcaceae cyanobacterium RL_1_2]|nr:hypothetical protein [Synechococcaceae cyanobacterium RL_1_2]